MRRLHADNGLSKIDTLNCVPTAAPQDGAVLYVRTDFWCSSLNPDTGPYTRAVPVPTRTLGSLLGAFRHTVVMSDIEGAETGSRGFGSARARPVCRGRCPDSMTSTRSRCGHKARRRLLVLVIESGHRPLHTGRARADPNPRLPSRRVPAHGRYVRHRRRRDRPVRSTTGLSRCPGHRHRAPPPQLSGPRTRRRGPHIPGTLGPGFAYLPCLSSGEVVTFHRIPTP